MSYLSWGYLVLNKAKLDNIFPSAQFSIPDYEIRVRRHRRKNEGRLIEFIKKGLIYKRLKYFDTSRSESISSEITVYRRKWLCFSIYWPPSNETLEVCFEKLKNPLSKANECYERFIIMGDFNIDVTNKEVEFDRLCEFCDLFNLTNLITSDCMFLPCHVRVSEWIHTP